MTEDSEIAVEFEDRRKDRPVTVRVVPLRWVIIFGSILFALWNIVGFPLLDYYVTLKFEKHNADIEAHTKLTRAVNEGVAKARDDLAEELSDINKRLARIEGAVAGTK